MGWVWGSKETSILESRPIKVWIFKNLRLQANTYIHNMGVVGIRAL